MFTKNLTRSTALAVFAAALLSGCGDSDEPTPNAAAPATTTEAGTTADAGTTPQTKFESVPEADASKPVGKKEGRWAEQLCTAMVGRTSAIKPPQVDTASPEGTLTSLRTFFADVVEEQGGQLKTLEQVGPPPGSKASSEWKKAVSELRTVKTDVTGVADELKTTKAGNAEELQAVIAKLGKELQSLSSYGGPIAALVSNPTIGPALLREPACSKFT